MSRNKSDNGFKVDLRKEGLEMFGPPYVGIMLRKLWSMDAGEAIVSGEMWTHANEVLAESEKTISRASIIFKLNKFVDDGICDFEDRTGKGGHHRAYYAVMDERAFWKMVAKTFAERVVAASGLHPEILFLATEKTPLGLATAPITA